MFDFFFHFLVGWYKR